MRISTPALGWYHIGAALAGGIFTLWAWAHGARLPTGALATAAVPFAASFAAGTALLQNRPRAKLLACVVQALQIPIVIIPALTWEFVAGAVASLTVTADGPYVFAGLKAAWFVGTGRSDVLPVTLGINFAPFVVIALIAWARPRKVVAPEQPGT